MTFMHNTHFDFAINSENSNSSFEIVNHVATSDAAII